MLHYKIYDEEEKYNGRCLIISGYIKSNGTKTLINNDWMLNSESNIILIKVTSITEIRWNIPT